MALSVYERRKFVRVDVHFQARLNKTSNVAIKKISLGGCLVESAHSLDAGTPVQLELRIYGEDLKLSGNIIHNSNEDQYGIRFDSEANEQTLRLGQLIEKAQQFMTHRRATRIPVQRKAALDNKNALLSDLSEGGCFLKTTQPFVRGDIVEIRFPVGEEEVHLAGQVRWKTAQGIGIAFLSPDPTQIYHIARYISRKTSKVRF
ncbi:MAG TPA: PilZ domain-containing protein [Nitrospiria bacterium]|nr:PilZ domain-containing protein [Nitrospiria bacterium]